MLKPSYHLWRIFDQRVGNQRQLEALSNELTASSLADCQAIEDVFLPDKKLSKLFPAGLLMPSHRRHLTRAITFDTNPNGNHLILSVGGRTAGFTRHLKKKLKSHYSDAHVMLIQVLNPYIAHHAFDMILTPHHDKAWHDKIGHDQTGHTCFLNYTGSLTPINRQRLDSLQIKKPNNTKLKKTLILIGGPNRRFDFIDRDQNALLDLIQKFSSQNLMVSTSRRTPDALVQRIEKVIDPKHHQLFTPQSGQENPYLSWLANADQIIVTQDSINMILDAVMSERPVCVYPLTPNPLKTFINRSNKYQDFLNSLIKKGLVCSYAPDLSKITPPNPQALADLKTELPEICKTILKKIVSH